MFFTSVTILSAILAVAARRPLSYLLQRRFRWIVLLWLAVALHLVFVPPATATLLARPPMPGLPQLGGLLYTCSLSLLLVFTWGNRRISGVAVIGVGLLMNAAVIIANGGQMPVSPAQLGAKGALQELRDAAASGEWSSFTVMTDETHLAWFGDRVSFPMPFREPTILSVGDLVIAVGIAMFFLVVPEAAAARRAPWPGPSGVTALGRDKLT